MRRFMRMFRFPLLLLAALCTGMASGAPAAEPAEYYIVPPRCPDDAMALHTANALDPAVSADDPIQITTQPGENAVQIDKDGNMQISGRVEIRQGQRQFSAANVKYDRAEDHFDIDGNVEYRDPQMVVRGNAGSLSREQAAFKGAQFELPQRSARGAAQSLSLTRDGILKLDGVRYTTCPPDSPDWQIKADRVSIDTARSMGTARDARVEFLGVPILRLPVISFPVGNARKSGVLFPSLGSTTRSGAQLSVPYYFNLAPNQDLTLTPTWYSRRGIDIGGQYRYLTRSSHGEISGNLLPSDKRADRSRNRLQLDNVTELPRGWRLTLDAENVSDAQYFEDFYQGADGSSVAFLPRRLQLSFRGDHLDAGLLMRNFQTLDLALPQTDRPYTEVPRMYARGNWQMDLPSLPLLYGFDSEAAAFRRSEGVEGWRVDAAPQLALNYVDAGYFVRPALAVEGTWYKLRDTAPGVDDSPDRVLPIASFDAGMQFERESGRNGQRRITLEPRLMYLYVPYRDQADLPVFDTAEPDLNWIELFRTNRYAGIDRISDANQLSAGVTTQLYSSASGTRFLSTTLGQTFYFSSPRVTLPDEPSIERHASDLIAQVELQAFRNWNVSLGMQWDHEETQARRAEAHVRYQPAPQSVVNLGYRFQRDRMEQADLSAAWPISDHWRLYGRTLYSLRDDQFIERFAGFEYDSCCWRVRAVARDYVSRRSGDRDRSIYLQLELKGLSSVGQAADAFLERAIRGYSASSRPR
jgi:LPS-assembly protein